MTVKVEKFAIAKLKSHPKQHEFFRESTVQEVRQLAEDMERNGQREPITVLRNGTIICGHIRRAAAKLLNWTKIDAIVRDDLVGKDDEVERLLISDNAIRHQLSKLERVRCAVRLFELEGGAQSTETHERAHARKRVAEQMGLSEKEVARFLAVLAAPAEVQLAFDAGLVSLVDVVRVAKLPEAARNQIGQRIRKQGIDKAKGIIQEHLPKPASAPQDPNQAYGELRDALAAACRALCERLNEINFADGTAEDHLADLRKGQALLGQLMAAEERAMDCQNDGQADDVPLETAGHSPSGTRHEDRERNVQETSSDGPSAGRAKSTRKAPSQWFVDPGFE